MGLYAGYGHRTGHDTRREKLIRSTYPLPAHREQMEISTVRRDPVNSFTGFFYARFLPSNRYFVIIKAVFFLRAT